MTDLEFRVISKYIVVKSNLLWNIKTARKINSTYKERCVFSGFIAIGILLMFLENLLMSFGCYPAIADEYTTMAIVNIMVVSALMAMPLIERQKSQFLKDLEYVVYYFFNCPWTMVLNSTDEELKEVTKLTLKRIAGKLIYEEREFGRESSEVKKRKKEFEKSFEITKRLGFHDEKSWKPFFEEIQLPTKKRE